MSSFLKVILLTFYLLALHVTSMPLGEKPLLSADNYLTFTSTGTSWLAPNTNCSDVLPQSLIAKTWSNKSYTVAPFSKLQHSDYHFASAKFTISTADAPLTIYFTPPECPGWDLQCAVRAADSKGFSECISPPEEKNFEAVWFVPIA